MDFGAELRLARERKGVSLREIADSTKISARALDALEKNDISRLPGGIFTRAIIRSYASEIGLDPDQAMRSFTEQFPGAGGSWSPEQTDDNFESRRQAAGVVVGIVTLAIAIGAIFLFLNFRARDRAAQPQPATDAPVAATSFQAPAPAPEPSPVAAAAAPVPDPPAKPGELVVAVQPSGPCWISLTADGKRLVSREVGAGERETVHGMKEVLVAAGDAGALKFSINGLPGRVMGKPGEVVTLRITPENFRTFLSAP